MYAGSGQRPAAYPPPSQAARRLPGRPGRPTARSRGPAPGRRRSCGRPEGRVHRRRGAGDAGGGRRRLRTRRAVEQAQHDPAARESHQRGDLGPAHGAVVSECERLARRGQRARPRRSPSASSGLVTVGAGVASTGAEPAVETLLSHYFHGINTHNYAEYASTLNPRAAGDSRPQSEFDTGYWSTDGLRDDADRLPSTPTRPDRDGDVHQPPVARARASTAARATPGRSTYYLVPRATGYLIGAAPSGYQPTYSDC